MADKPSVSKLQNAREEFLNNAKNIESARFLKRILQKADDPPKIGKSDYLERAYYFTGLDKRIFPLLNANVQITELKDIDRFSVHERYVTLYLNASRCAQIPRPNEAPTTKNLFATLYGKIPHYVDIRTFRKYLAKMGYAWLKIAKGYIVIEKPCVTFERYYYLKDVVRFREENRPIFYVDEAVLTGTCNYYDLKKYNSLLKAAADAVLEIVQRALVKIIYAVSKTGVHALKVIGDFTSANFEKWILDDLLPALPPKSVVVIKNTEHHDNSIKKPTLYSIKADMIDWLVRNDVPHDEDMSKCELISLIDTYTTEADEVFKIESMLKIHGHDLLRLPFSIEEITPAKSLFDLIKLNTHKQKVKCEDGLRNLIKKVKQTTFEEFDKDAADFEKETLNIDLKMDEVFDGVVRNLQNVRLNDQEDSEVPLSDSD